MRSFIVLFTLIFLNGCLVIDDSQMPQTSTKTSIKLESKIKELVLLNEHKINPKLTVELIKNGFKVKPYVSQTQVTEKSKDREIKYNQSAARFGIKINSQYNGMTCVFSTNRVEEFSFTLIDLKTNDIIDIFEKRGPTGKCPPLTPIYIIYSKYLKAYK